MWGIAIRTWDAVLWRSRQRGRLLPMAHVFLDDGRRLRVRLFPRPKRQPHQRRAAPPSLSLFDSPADDSLDTATERLAARVVELCLFNRNNALILDRFPQLGLRDWWLASGCLFQTVWNLKSGRPADSSIVDYDVCYFSEDTSWDAEDEVIRSASALFTDLTVTVQVRNQARVHLWYPEKFGVAYPPLTTAARAFEISRLGPNHRHEKDRRGLYRCVRAVWSWRCLGHGGAPQPRIAHGGTLRRKNRPLRAVWPRLTVYPWADGSKEKTT